MSRPRTIVDAFDGPFSAWLGDPVEWAAWRTFLKVMAGAPLGDAELDLFTRCTGRTVPPAAPVTEAWLIVGRRGRKSATAAMVGVYQAIYPDWSRFIAKGETARVLIVGVSKDQSRLVRSYAEAILRSRPGLARLIVGCDSESITLRNKIEIKCVANSFRSVRGPTCVCAVFDEVAFWRDETSANPDTEVLRAVKPSMLTVKGAVLIGLSSPHAKRGLLYTKHRDHFACDDSRVLVWAADTLTMNPRADREEIEDRFQDDPEAAASEYGFPGEGIRFREDLVTFLDADLVNSLARTSPVELPPREGIAYQAFTDPSGGRGDAFALAIGHKERDGLGVVDLVRATPAPFDPAVVVHDYAAVLKSYRISEATGDAYSGEWVTKAFEAEGIRYRTSDKPKVELYLEALPLFTRGAIELPDDRRLLVELSTLERRTARGGRESVDHQRGGHDDRANVVCGLLVGLGERRGLPADARVAELAVLGRPLVAADYGADTPWFDHEAFHRDYPIN
jgi:hypothetical protein